MRSRTRYVRPEAVAHLQPLLANFRRFHGLVDRCVNLSLKDLMVVLFPHPDSIAACFARFRVAGGVGSAVISSHREYGQKIGDQRSGWLKANGPSVEQALKGLETIPLLADLTKSGAGRNEDLRAAEYALRKQPCRSAGLAG